MSILYMSLIFSFILFSYAPAFIFGFYEAAPILAENLHPDDGHYNWQLTQTHPNVIGKNPVTKQYITELRNITDKDDPKILGVNAWVQSKNEEMDWRYYKAAPIIAENLHPDDGHFNWQLTQTHPKAKGKNPVTKQYITELRNITDKYDSRILGVYAWVQSKNREMDWKELMTYGFSDNLKLDVAIVRNIWAYGSGNYETIIEPPIARDYIVMVKNWFEFNDIHDFVVSLPSGPLSITEFLDRKYPLTKQKS